MRKDFLRTLFSRMLATYMGVTIGLLLLSGVIVGALISGFVMRREKQNIANEISVVIAEILPSVPIYPYPEVVATDAGLANYGTATFKSNRWDLVGFTE